MDKPKRRSDRYYERRGRKKIAPYYPIMIASGIVMQRFGIDCNIKDHFDIIEMIVNVYKEYKKRYNNYSQIYQAVENRLKQHPDIYLYYEGGVRMADDFIENGVEFYREYRTEGFL